MLMQMRSRRRSSSSEPSGPSRPLTRKEKQINAALVIIGFLIAFVLFPLVMIWASRQPWTPANRGQGLDHPAP